MPFVNVNLPWQYIYIDKVWIHLSSTRITCERKFQNLLFLVKYDFIIYVASENMKLKNKKSYFQVKLVTC